MAELLLVSLKKIHVAEDRGRQSFTGLMELADSIKKHKLIHPIVVAARSDGRYELVAGERRYKAAILAGLSEVHVTLRDETDPDVLAEIELEENIRRSDLCFEEEGRILEKIQNLRRKKDKKWTLEKTAELTGRSTGDVSTKIKLAKKFTERPELREACKNLPYSAAIKKVTQIEAAEKVERLQEQGKITLSTDLLKGSCLDLIKDLKDKSIDLVVTDPPYGLAKLEKLRGGKSEKFIGHQLMSETHNMSLGDVLKLLKDLAPELGRVMKDGSHFYMFCGFQFAGDFINALEPHLEFQPPLLVWDRGRPSSPGYGYNYLSRLEAIIYGYKPPRGRRLNKDMYNLIECPDVPRPLRIYPTEKPQPLLQVLIENSSTLNDLVLDPFAGSASTLLAAKKCGRRGIGFEIDNEAFLRAQQRLIEK